MASNYTTNYELPLWEPQDSFLRTEFNEAHQKIDDALAENLHLFPVHHAVLGEDVAEWEIPLSGQDFSDTLTLYLYGTVGIDDSVDCDRIYLRVNGAASGYMGTNNSQSYLLCFQGASMAGAVTSFQAEITGMAAPGISGVTTHCLVAHGVSACTLRYPKVCESSGMMSLAVGNTISSLNLVASSGNQLKTGSQITLMGVRW